jgi:hypothetical protein
MSKRMSTLCQKRFSKEDFDHARKQADTPGNGNYKTGPFAITYCPYCFCRVLMVLDKGVLRVAHPVIWTERHEDPIAA